MIEWVHIFRYSKAWVQTKLGIIVIPFRCAPSRQGDMRFILRIGGGDGATMAPFEVGLLGYAIAIAKAVR